MVRRPYRPVADLHGTEIELAQLRLDLRAIPDGHHDELAWYTRYFSAAAFACAVETASTRAA